MGNAREFIDFWIENSVHATERYGTPGASQDAAELARRLVEAARGQGISATELEAEVGDIATYIGEHLKAANEAESDRRKST